MGNIPVKLFKFGRVVRSGWEKSMDGVRRTMHNDNGQRHISIDHLETKALGELKEPK